MALTKSQDNSIQRERLLQLYGKAEYEKDVKEIYSQLEMDKEYEQLEMIKKQEFSILTRTSFTLVQDEPIREIFKYLSAIIFDRKK